MRCLTNSSIRVGITDLGPAEWKSEAEVLMDRTEFWQTFRDCLSKLPARVADVFMLREMEEM